MLTIPSAQYQQPQQQQQRQRQQRLKSKHFKGAQLNNDTIINSSSSSNINDNHLYLVDAFRTPLAHLFELNDFLRRFRTLNLNNKNNSSEQLSLIDDLCVHVGQTTVRHSRLKPQETSSTSDSMSDSKQRSYLPEFNCLYLSPANFWSNDFGLFNQDEDIIQTINDSPDFKLNLGVNSMHQQLNNNNNKDHTKSQSKKQRPFDLNRLLSLANRILFSSSSILDEDASTDLSELLFGVSWNSVVSALKVRKKEIF